MYPPSWFSCFSAYEHQANGLLRVYYISDIFGDALSTSALFIDTNVIDFVKVLNYVAC